MQGHVVVKSLVQAMQGKEHITVPIEKFIVDFRRTGTTTDGYTLYSLDVHSNSVQRDSILLCEKNNGFYAYSYRKPILDDTVPPACLFKQGAYTGYYEKLQEVYTRHAERVITELAEASGIRCDSLHGVE